MTDDRKTQALPRMSCDCGNLKNPYSYGKHRFIEGMERSVCLLCDTPLRIHETGELFDEEQFNEMLEDFLPTSEKIVYFQNLNMRDNEWPRAYAERLQVEARELTKRESDQAILEIINSPLITEVVRDEMKIILAERHGYVLTRRGEVRDPNFLNKLGITGPTGQAETREGRERRICAEIDELTKNKSTTELLNMLAMAQANSFLRKEFDIMNSVRGSLGVNQADSNGFLELEPSKVPESDRLKGIGPNAGHESMVQRIIDFRDEVDGLLTPATELEGIEKQVVGKFKQSLGNLIFWYGQWERNKDYSSVINASMALGKLSTATEVLQYYRSVGNNIHLDAIIDAVTNICSECWENIRAATGRIVPFEN